ncbi:MAG: energy-coupling factor transporter ATPase [Firmicutes bacterium]|jgi:energy-coupling factor transport system ATP-binding protein|nr:energy-coupling factor transporter ATPase [Bacillota bacterium]
MIIEARNLSHTYMKGTPLAKQALHDVNLGIEEGEFVGVIGRTGSGKSTLVQHFNGLLKPGSGQILVGGRDIWERGVAIRDIRRMVGLVFQYPEHQLFEETVFADVAFGPRNMGLSEPDVEDAVREAMRMVNLEFDSLRDRSPFELSGGQKRRAAIAGVLAMRPKVLVLDEPTAGMDPRGREEVLGHVRQLHDEHGLTIVLVSHSMEDVARLADRLIVVDQGAVVMNGTPREVFAHPGELTRMGLGVPQVTQVVAELAARGYKFRTDAVTVGEALDTLLPALLDAKKGAKGVGA